MQTLTQGQYEFLASLLNVLITKLKYDEDTEWGADQEDTEEDEFVNLRKVSANRDGYDIFY
jgi:exportin-T